MDFSNPATGQKVGSAPFSAVDAYCMNVSHCDKGMMLNTPEQDQRWVQSFHPN
jgi:hypothetical protein